MTLDELQAQAAHDLKVNDEHLDTESLKNQEIKAVFEKPIIYGDPILKKSFSNKIRNFSHL